VKVRPIVADAGRSEHCGAYFDPGGQSVRGDRPHPFLDALSEIVGRGVGAGGVEYADLVEEVALAAVLVGGGGPDADA
jgi:hypothetical protein